ncbi:MAG: tryptophan-rich sensory protein [Acidobacteriia bacterium]|nr:tryptophan-rich sensory protein [Methyloceanibacter sp.]MBX5471111.1 tryptophan-rich sensory protein [Acetobacteraceae bacterium]MCL6491439.1 tryptophan-rich sensory protein [Terriglobia bacterium]
MSCSPGAGRDAELARFPRRQKRAACFEEGRVFLKSEPPEWGASPGAPGKGSSALALIGFVGLALLVGIVGRAASGPGGQGWYLGLRHPPGALPGLLLGQAFIPLSFPLGLSAWLVWQRIGASAPLRIWGWLLLFGALWPVVLFVLHNLPAGGLLTLLLCAFSFATVMAFWRNCHTAALLLLPSLAWAGYLAYLSFGLWWLNS